MTDIYWDLEKCLRAEKVLMAVKPMIKLLHRNAEAEHDNYGSPYFADSVQYEIMEDTAAALEAIDDILEKNTIKNITDDFPKSMKEQVKDFLEKK